MYGWQGQIPIIEFLKKKFKVDYIDMITEPRTDKILAEGNKELIFWIKEKIKISVKNHNSKVIAIVGHADCAGNPVKKHIEQIKKV